MNALQLLIDTGYAPYFSGASGEVYECTVMDEDGTEHSYTNNDLNKLIKHVLLQIDSEII